MSSSSPPLQAIVDPLDFSPLGGSLSAVCAAFAPLPGAAAQSPASAGYAAGLERLEYLLRIGGPPKPERYERQLYAPSPSPTAAAASLARAATAPCTVDASLAAIGARLRVALTASLDPIEADELASALYAAPRAALTSGVGPALFPALVSNAPTVAVAFMVAAARSGPRAMTEAYVDALLPKRGLAGDVSGASEAATETAAATKSNQYRRSSSSTLRDGGEEHGDFGFGAVDDKRPVISLLSLRNLEVAHALLLHFHGGAGAASSGGSAPLLTGSSTHLPDDFRDRHLSAALTAATAAGGTRGVRLVCAYVRALMRDGLLVLAGGVAAGNEPPPIVEEIKAFAVAHAEIVEAAELFKSLVGADGRAEFSAPPVR